MTLRSESPTPVERRLLFGTPRQLVGALGIRVSGASLVSCRNLAPLMEDPALAHYANAVRGNAGLSCPLPLRSRGQISAALDREPAINLPSTSL